MNPDLLLSLAELGVAIFVLGITFFGVSFYVLQTYYPDLWERLNTPIGVKPSPPASPSSSEPRSPAESPENEAR